MTKHLFVLLVLFLSSVLSAVAQTNIQPSAAALQARAEFIKRYHPLRVANGKLYDFTHFFQKRAAKYEVAGFFDYQIEAKILQVLEEGLIVKTKDALVFVKNYPGQAKVVDGDEIETLAVPTGRYQYLDTTGAKRTVQSYDCGRYFDPATDAFQRKVLVNQFEILEAAVTSFDRQ